MKRYFNYIFAALLSLGAVACTESAEKNGPDAPAVSKMKGVFHAEVVGSGEIVEIFPGKSKEIMVKACASAETGVSDLTLTISFKADAEAAEAYNAANGTSCVMLPGSAYEFTTNDVMMPRYGTSSTTAKVKLTTAGLEDGVTYVLPITIDRVAGTDNWALSENPVAYVLVQQEVVPPDAGTGTEADPFNLYTKADMLAMGAKLEDGVKIYFRLKNDIDMEGVNWMPLNFASPYTKQIDFDGAGHTISNFSCSFANYPSFFGVLYGDCYDVNFVNATINNGGTNACGIIGAYCGTANLPGVCRNVHVEGTVISETGDRGVGGLFGRVHFGTVLDCSAKCTVTGSGSKTGVGGLVGWLNGTIERCWADCIVTNNANYTGGLVGYDNTTSVIKDCWTTGSVTGPQRVGGIIGGLLKAGTQVINCYSTAKLTSGFCIGGIAGHCNLDKGSSDLPTSTEGLYVIEGCVAWNEEITATNTDDQDHYSSGAIAGYISTRSYLRNCWRKADLNFNECATQSANVLYDMPDVSVEAPLVQAAGTRVFNYPYHGKAAAATQTLSALAKNLGWSTSIWDFSGDLPVFKAVDPAGGSDVNAGGQLPDFGENVIY